MSRKVPTTLNDGDQGGGGVGNSFAGSLMARAGSGAMPCGKGCEMADGCGFLPNERVADRRENGSDAVRRRDPWRVGSGRGCTKLAETCP